MMTATSEAINDKGAGSHLNILTMWDYVLGSLLLNIQRFLKRTHLLNSDMQMSSVHRKSAELTNPIGLSQIWKGALLRASAG